MRGALTIEVNTFVRLHKRKRNADGSYYKHGATHKKAIVTCEETIPDEVKMYVLPLGFVARSNGIAQQARN